MASTANRRARGRVTAWVALALAIASSACTPKEGDACKPGGDACEGPSAALVCVGGRVAKVACGGPGGCTANACDDSIAADGDACALEGDVACSADGRTMLACQNGKFAASEPCRGERGCKAEGGAVTCDVGIAHEGDACKSEGNRACSTDRGGMLTCNGGAFRASARCRGAKGCLVKEARVDCDDSIADEGDACDADGDVACTSDARGMLTCKGHVFTAAKACKGKCNVTGDGVACL